MIQSDSRGGRASRYVERGPYPGLRGLLAKVGHTHFGNHAFCQTNQKIKPKAGQRTEAKKPLVRGTECVELLAHEQRQPLDSRRPREVARHAAKGRDRFGAHEQMDSGGVTPAGRAFHGDANRRLLPERN